MLSDLTDFYGGSMTELIASIKNKLFVLLDDTTVYPEHMQEYDWNGDAAIVESYISYLRRKIDQIAGSDGEAVAPLIQTRRGVGYMLREPKGD